jgi:dephospho-CoA kinase
MAKVLITGMSGTGKSSALHVLAKHGHNVVDTDDDRWSRWITLPNGDRDWIWREDAISDLLVTHVHGNLFVAGCKSNQGKFYPLFDHIVLLSAPADVLLQRVATRTNNPYGKTAQERARILHDLALVEPLLRAGAMTEIDASQPLADVVRRLEELATTQPSPG